MNKYKVKVYKTITQEFSVDIYANSPEDIKKIVTNSEDFSNILDDADIEDEHFEDSIYDCNISDIYNWDWLLDPYNEDIIEETYELGEIELKDEDKKQQL